MSVDLSSFILRQYRATPIMASASALTFAEWSRGQSYIDLLLVGQLSDLIEISRLCCYRYRTDVLFDAIAYRGSLTTKFLELFIFICLFDHCWLNLFDSCHGTHELFKPLFFWLISFLLCHWVLILLDFQIRMAIAKHLTPKIVRLKVTYLKGALARFSWRSAVKRVDCFTLLESAWLNFLDFIPLLDLIGIAWGLWCK